jgi:hypothetical protein
LVDGAHMLRLVLRRLTEDAGLRARLGSAARRYWSRHATMALMARDYERALARAAVLAAPPRPAGWPAHLTADGTSTARGLLGQMGVSYPLEPPGIAAAAGTEPGRIAPSFTPMSRAGDA